MLGGGLGKAPHHLDQTKREREKERKKERKKERDNVNTSLIEEIRFDLSLKNK